MRQQFEHQTTMGITPISEVKFPRRSRDEMPPVLKSLQYIFVTPELNKKIFSLLEKKVCAGKKKTGRTGMDLWHILVLAVVRHTLNTNWDRLEYLSNYDVLMRQILGIHADTFDIPKKEFFYQTIVDNVSLIDEQTLYEINILVVSHGQKLLNKKKEDKSLMLKTDSYVLQTNVHFPTDLNLLWDALRKGLDTIEKLQQETCLNGWRKIKLIYRNTKSIFRKTSQQVFRGKNEKQKKQAVQQYLNEAKKLERRFSSVILHLSAVVDAKKILNLIAELCVYNEYVKKQINLIERRLLFGEKIEASEKIHSVFEPHTEWINKGKHFPSVELGHLLLITTDQNQFIVDYKVMEKEKDVEQVESLMERLHTTFPGQKIYSHSFDKGFFSKDNYQCLMKAQVENIILPKKGKLNTEEKERESNKTFKELRNAHSAVESNINMLEHHGLNRCVDKGLYGYKKYVGLSVLAYNLHILGNHLIVAERKKEKEKQKQRDRYYRYRYRRTVA
ncbi:MAG: ISNCY family transposase [Nanoarchaeota archaeon]|nr:ISNCY family transposase [Nanoarchaeota archaeon]